MPSSVTGATDAAALDQRQASGNPEQVHDEYQDLSALSPTQRQSERKRKVVCYEKMNNGR